MTDYSLPLSFTVVTEELNSLNCCFFIHAIRLKEIRIRVSVGFTKFTKVLKDVYDTMYVTLFYVLDSTETEVAVSTNHQRLKSHMLHTESLLLKMTHANIVSSSICVQMLHV